MVGTAEDRARAEAVVGEDADGEVTGFSHLADGGDRLAAVDFAETAAHGIRPESRHPACHEAPARFLGYRAINWGAANSSVMV